MNNSLIASATGINPANIALPPLREDLILQAAARGPDGAPHWHIVDPVRNRFFRIGWLEYELLARWQHSSSVAAVCAAVCRATPLMPQADDVLALMQFLDANELLLAGTPQQRAKLTALAQRRQLSIPQWLLHHYLFIRIPLVRPDGFLTRTGPLFVYLFQPAFLLLVIGLAVLGLVRVAGQWDEFSSTFLYFFSWEGLLLYGVALSLAKLLHELGHAYTAKHFGLRVPTMGLAFMMMWPLLYTDTSEGWKLASRRARLAIGGAGIIAELLLAGLAALAWSIAPDGAFKSAAYILAAVTWISTLLINLNPFMRFDGYYLLMDAVDMPNLHERSFAFGRWHLRRLCLGLRDPVPESAFDAHKHWLILYAYATWLYRLVMFTGIAVAVYYFFFKAAGIILFAVEIGWFVVRPIVNELEAWRQLHPRWRGHSTPRWMTLFLLLMLISLAVPWQSEVTANGYWQAARHTRLFPPAAARLDRILVREGQAVHAGESLFTLSAPELESQRSVLQARVAGLKAQIAGAVGNALLLEHVPVQEQELAAAHAALAAVEEELARLQVTAPHDGMFRDLSPGLYPGAWLGPQHILGRVTDGTQILVQVFVGEADVGRIRRGAHARILERRADARPVDAIVTGIDTVATRILPEPLLASSHGGPIAARNGPKGELIANEALYRVTLELKADSAAAMRLAGVTAHIDAERSSPLWNFLRAAAGVAIRESGF